jgi:hypothetical protein
MDRRAARSAAPNLVFDEGGDLFPPAAQEGVGDMAERAHIDIGPPSRIKRANRA